MLDSTHHVRGQGHTWQSPRIVFDGPPFNQHAASHQAIVPNRASLHPVTIQPSSQCVIPFYALYIMLAVCAIHAFHFIYDSVRFPSTRLP